MAPVVGRRLRARAFGYAGGVMPASCLAAAGATVFHDLRELPRLLGETPPS